MEPGTPAEPRGAEAAARRLPGGFGEFFRFGLTGALGAVTNLSLFFAGADLLALPATAVSVVCFLAAASQGYVINHRWSFRNLTRHEPLSLRGWLRFVCASLLGLGVNILVMNLIIRRYDPPFKFIAQAGGILSGLLINFSLSKLLVFRKKDAP